MVNTISMQELRYINLFRKITKISTRFCFMYGEWIVFCVPKKLLSKAIGKDGKNVREINNILRKKVKIISLPSGVEDAESFIKNIVSPANFKSIEVNDNEIIINAGGTQNKAALMGRNKLKLQQLQKIVKSYFKRELKIA